MEIWPALDILDGQVVRLQQGDYSRQTIYGGRPLEFLEEALGTMPPRLHLVDLTGAQTGRFSLFALAENLIKRGVDLEVGGGIRRSEDVEHLVDIGVKHIVLGTQVVIDPGFRRQVLDQFESHLVMALDILEDCIQIAAWDRPGPLARDFWRELYAEGWRKANITDIHRDGTLEGLRQDFWLPWTTESGDFAAGGGVRTVEDLQQLEHWGLARAVVGKAWIEGTIPKEALFRSC